MKKTFYGPCGIKATILAHSINAAGQEIITYELEYPRIILAELNTHRMLSKNSFSSRAVPFAKMLQQLDGRPVRFGANQAGMQDSGEHDAPIIFSDIDQYGNDVEYPLWSVEAWEQAKQAAIVHAEAFSDAGYHKQVFNRLLEPWQMMKTVLTGTEFPNFFWLRKHGAADPTFEALAQTMWEAKEASTPVLLKAGEWHLPYIDFFRDDSDEALYRISDEFAPDDGTKLGFVTLEEAIKVSCARCAAVSYRNEGYNLAKSIEVYDKLVGADRKHASAFEHQATPMEAEYINNDAIYGLDNFGVNVVDIPSTWEQGITHMDRSGILWSGNLKGFIQYRKLIPDENYVGS